MTLANFQCGNLVTAEDNACLHILHVDDDPYILEAFKERLRVKANFEVNACSSVDEAFKKLEEHA